MEKKLESNKNELDEVNKNCKKKWERIRNLII